LERLKFPGYWDCDENGVLIGEDEKNNYRFEIGVRANGKFDFSAMRRNKKSGRETRISKYCQKNMTEKECKSLQKKFMQAVVMGSL